MVEKTSTARQDEPMPQWALEQQQEIAKVKKVVWINCCALFGALGSCLFALLGLLPLTAKTLAGGLLIGAVLGTLDVVAMSVSVVWRALLRVTVYFALCGALGGMVLPNSWFAILLGAWVGGCLGILEEICGRDDETPTTEDRQG